MRSTDERVKSALRGAKIRRRQQERRRIYILSGVSGVCSLCVVIVLALFMPSMMDGWSGMSITMGFSASIFSNTPSLGYIVLGVISFLLGISVTLLCILLRNRLREEEDDS